MFEAGEGVGAGVGPASSQATPVHLLCGTHAGRPCFTTLRFMMLLSSL